MSKASSMVSRVCSAAQAVTTARATAQRGTWARGPPGARLGAPFPLAPPLSSPHNNTSAAFHAHPCLHGADSASGDSHAPWRQSAQFSPTQTPAQPPLGAPCGTPGPGTAPARTAMLCPHIRTHTHSRHNPRPHNQNHSGTCRGALQQPSQHGCVGDVVLAQTARAAAQHLPQTTQRAGRGHP